MPNYIRTQNPWIAAAESLDQISSPLARMYAQLPQVRAQMQQHADQMGIQQGRLMLDQQEMGAKIPVFNAQANNYNAEAGYHEQQAAQLRELISNALSGSLADTNPLTQPMTRAALLNPNAAQQMRADVTKPLTLNQNETAFSNPALGPVQPLAQGMVNAPFGNTVLGGIPLSEQVTNRVGPNIQGGAFRPFGSAALDPTTRLKNVAGVLDTLGKTDMTEEQLAPFVELLQSLVPREGGGTNAPTTSGLNVGDKRKGYIYQGGDPAKQESWRKE